MNGHVLNFFGDPVQIFGVEVFLEQNFEKIAKPVQIKRQTVVFQITLDFAVQFADILVAVKQCFFAQFFGNLLSAKVNFLPSFPANAKTWPWLADLYFSFFQLNL